MINEHLVAAFEDGSLSPNAFGHREHLYVAWTYAQREPFGAAGDRFCLALRRYGEAHGVARLFHATISWAYLVLVHERLQNGPSTFTEFAQANPDLFDHAGGVLRRVYDDETLFSERARRVFVLPTAPSRSNSGGDGRRPLP